MDLEWTFEGATELRYRRALLPIDVIGNQLQIDSGGDIPLEGLGLPDISKMV